MRQGQKVPSVLILRSVARGVYWMECLIDGLNGARGGCNPQTWLHVDLGAEGHRVSVFTAYVRVCLATAHCYWQQRREFIEGRVRAVNIWPAVSFANLIVFWLSGISCVVLEPKCSLPYSQERATGLCSEVGAFLDFFYKYLFVKRYK